MSYEIACDSVRKRDVQLLQHMGQTSSKSPDRIIRQMGTKKAY